MNDDGVQLERVVYVVQEVLRKDRMTGKLIRVHNLTPALRFGKLKILLDSRRFPLTTQPVVDELAEKLANYTADDYILPVGSFRHIMIVASIAAKRTGGKVRLLEWDRPTGQYLEVFYDVGA